MPLSRLTCPICLAVLKPSQPVAEGSRVRCPKCKGAFVAEGEPRPEEPAPEAVQEPLPHAIEEPPADDVMDAVEATDDEIAAEPPRKKSRAQQHDDLEERPRKRAKARDDEEEDRPRKRRAKKAGVPLWVWLTVGGVGLVLVCGCCGIPGALYATGNLNLPGAGKGTASGSGSALFSFGTVVTQDNYNKLQRNMTEAQVIAVLGPPTQQSAILGLKVDVWQNGTDIIEVTFDKAGHANMREGRFTSGGVTTVVAGF